MEMKVSHVWSDKPLARVGTIATAFIENEHKAGFRRSHPGEVRNVSVEPGLMSGLTGSQGLQARKRWISRLSWRPDADYRILVLGK
jgi:hypothetical protein